MHGAERGRGFSGCTWSSWRDKPTRFPAAHAWQWAGCGGGVEGGISLSLSTPSLRWPSIPGSSELGEHSSFLLSHCQCRPEAPNAILLHSEEPLSGHSSGVESPTALLTA